LEENGRISFGLGQDQISVVVAISFSHKVVSASNFSFPFSYVVMTTSGGIMDHEEARRKHLGGKILGFFF
jgi:ribosomal protein S8